MEGVAEIGTGVTEGVFEMGAGGMEGVAETGAGGIGTEGAASGAEDEPWTNEADDGKTVSILVFSTFVPALLSIWAYSIAGQSAGGNTPGRLGASDRPPSYTLCNLQTIEVEGLVAFRLMIRSCLRIKSLTHFAFIFGKGMPNLLRTGSSTISRCCSRS